MTDAERKGMRIEKPEMWAKVSAAIREMVGDWTDDEIANVVGKVIAPSPDLLMDHIAEVIGWCAAAQASDDEEAQATVDLWKQLPPDIIEITVEDGRVCHRINPDADVRFEHD